MSSLLHAESCPDDTVIITVAGVVAYQSPEQIPGAVHAAIVRWAPRVILLDLGDVHMLDGAGMAALLAGQDVAARADVTVTLVNIGTFLSTQLREIGVEGAELQRVVDHDTTMDVPADVSPSGQLA